MSGFDGEDLQDTSPYLDAFADPDPFTDHASTNLFSAEIDGIDASDWDADTADIWDDHDATAAIDDGGGIAFDFPL